MADTAMTNAAQASAMRAVLRRIPIVGAAAIVVSVAACGTRTDPPPASPSREAGQAPALAPTPAAPEPEAPDAPGAPAAPPTAKAHVRPVRGLPDDPAERRTFIRENKLVSGWTAADTEHFLFLHATEVDPKLLWTITERAEALRADVLQPRFPIDAKYAGIQIIRVCKDRNQYMGYGAPGGSAGYFDANSEELVVYEDQNEKAATVATMQSLLCTAHLCTALGPRAGHAWFRVGFEGWASAHTMDGGRLAIRGRSWQRTAAVAFKLQGRAPRIADILAWDDSLRVPAPAALASFRDADLRSLSADLVEFLVASKDPAISAIPVTYYAALVRGVTKETALAEATQGIDLATVERAWLAF